MVLELVVADLLNRFLGDYVENLNKSQLKLGIWGDKPKEGKKDTFLEKLATQVIKNVQVKITDIHIKYEDDITDPERPLSFGVTLGEFSLLTTNEHWTPCILNEAEKIIYKDQLKREILTSSNIPPNYQYRGTGLQKKIDLTISYLTRSFI